MAFFTRVSMSACFLRSIFQLIAIYAFTFAYTASAAESQLRQELQISSAPTSTTQENWDWLLLDDATALRDLPAGWQLLVDQVRFAEVGVVVVTDEGRKIEIIKRADDLHNNWAPGGLLKFDIPMNGSRIDQLYLGFKNVDDLSLMRKVTAASPERAFILGTKWTALMSMFTGVLVSAFVYNLFVHVTPRQAFQRWYLGWAAMMLTYGLTWSNLAAFVVPGLAGPIAVRLDNIFISSAIALGGMFLISVLETGAVPRILRHSARVAALFCCTTGFIAADERIVTAEIGDKILNLGMISSVLVSVLVICAALVRQSRVVRIFLIGWLPLIAVFGARTARNFGLAAQSDILDYLTFAAIAFEAIVFSLMIATRFARLRTQRDEAEAKARELDVQRQALQKAAHTDFLTGLGNRSSFNLALNSIWNEAPNAFDLFLIDVDHLKEVNDQQGHDAGDALLRFTGSKLLELSANAVCVARLGGDEFAILARNSNGEADRISAELQKLQGSIWTNGASVGVLSLSVGKATSTDADSPAVVIKHADLALYQAKKQGRGRLQNFDDIMRRDVQTSLELVGDAGSALKCGEFVLHFQPIMDLRSQEIASVEALLRWNHPKRGLLSPGDFNCVFEDMKIGRALQHHVMEMAIEWLRTNATTTATLAVNCNSMDLRGAESAHRLLSMLETARVSARRLCIEVTEGTVVGRGADEPAEALRILHAAGVRVALDDFGTGYASFIHLRDIPADVLKIDRSFVQGLLEEDGRCEEIVRAILALGQGLRKDIIAEGVETVEQLDRLRELGCNFAQGYLLGRPSALLTGDGFHSRAA